MSTLYIRDVAPDVASTLKERAARHNQSLSAYVAEQLTLFARKPTQEDVLERLRHRDRIDAPSTQRIVEAIAEGRR